jgi:hypothetical protein
MRIHTIGRTTAGRTTDRHFRSASVSEAKAREEKGSRWRAFFIGGFQTQQTTINRVALSSGATEPRGSLEHFLFAAAATDAGCPSWGVNAAVLVRQRVDREAGDFDREQAQHACIHHFGVGRSRHGGRIAERRKRALL